MYHRKYNVAIVGVNLGIAKQLIKFLQQRTFPLNFLKPLVYHQIHNRYLVFNNADYSVDKVSTSSFRGMDFIFFMEDDDRKDEFVKSIMRDRGVIIDNTISGRKNIDIPLIVPEVNGKDISKEKKIYASPSSNAIFLLLVLKPLYNRVGLKKLVISVCEGVFNKTEDEIYQLKRQTKEFLLRENVKEEEMIYSSVFNIIPFTGKIEKDNYTVDEILLASEIKRVMHEPNLHISATIVKVPVFTANSIFLHIETKKKIKADEVKEILSLSPYIKILDDINKDIYPTPFLAQNKEEIFVGRIREANYDNCIDLFITGDIFKKGSALNILQIAEEIIRIRESEILI